LIKENYHKRVKKRDTVYFLGDVAFDEESLADVKTWAGAKKILICGNHCHTQGTELLTLKGWKPVEEISMEDFVATVDLDDDRITFENPKRVVFNESSELIKFSNPWVEDVVSSGHNVVVDGQLVPAISLVGEKLSTSTLKLSAFANNTGVGLPVKYMQLLMWVVMDGTMVRSSERKTRIQFKLSKERKISRLESLLQDLEIPYTKRICKKSGINKLQPYYIRIYGEHSLKIHDHLGGVKQLPESWTNMSLSEVFAVLQTLKETDGFKEVNKLRWVSSSKNDVEVLQQACITNGIAFSISEKLNGSGFANGKLQYSCYIDESSSVLSSKDVQVEKLPVQGKTYGVTMSKGTTIARRNGKVWVTGNCTDHFSMRQLVDAYDEVYSLFKYKNMWLSHAPIHPDELRGRVNIHGHTHYHVIDDSRYLNVCMEQIDYTPIELHELRKKIYGTD
jgi:calcineurin-like phosphoesterase family protein